MTVESSPPGRGGKRLGAGRKRTDPVRALTIKLPIEILEQVDCVSKNRTQFIRDALIEKLERMQKPLKKI